MILFKINSKTLSRNPTSIEQGKFKIQQSDRTINGTMVVDIIAVKNKVNFSWNYMSDSDLRKLLNEINSQTFVTVEYKDPDNENDLKSMIAETSEISYRPHYDNMTQSVIWKEVKVEFLER